MRFTIQDHHAHKAGHHWDLRLEIPDGNLAVYKEKRDFTKTAEPEGNGESMASWAIPKHKLPEPGKRVMGIRTEDHPLSYQDFEGTIPDGEYGAGEMSLVANGDYELESYNPEKGNWLINLPGFGRFKIIPFKKGGPKSCLIIGLKEE